MSQEDAWNETTIKLSKATEVIYHFNLTKLKICLLIKVTFYFYIFMRNVRKYAKIELFS